MVTWSGWIGRLWVLWLLVKFAWWRGGLPWTDEKVGGGNGLYMKELNICVRRLNMQGKGWTYKSSLRDSISRWTARGKTAKSGMIKTLKWSL